MEGPRDRLSTSVSREVVRKRAERDGMRNILCALPHNVLYELPGHPDVVYELRQYAHVTGGAGANVARKELPFLFRPFEMGQTPPNGIKKKKNNESTIHEFLDWTVTAAKPEADDSSDNDILLPDFSGFRVIVLLERERFGWPPPDLNLQGEMPKGPLGPSLAPIPYLVVRGKPVSCASIRSGRGFLEVSFFATRDNRRGRGFGRALLEAIEEVGRCCKCQHLLLCSTDDKNTLNTWKHLGFTETSDEQMVEWGIDCGDLVHMTNTIQLHKDIEEIKRYKSILIKHQGFKQRLYYESENFVIKENLGSALLSEKKESGYCLTKIDDKEKEHK